MAIAFVQSAPTGGTSGTYTNTAGNLLVASVIVFDGGSYPAPNSVSDTRNGAWTRAVQIGDSANVGTVEIWYRENCGAGSNTVTLSGTLGGAFTVFNIAEYSGAATSGSLDKTAGRIQNNLTAPSTGAVTTTGADLVLACVSCSNDDLSAGSGFTLVVPNDGNPFEYKIQTSAGSIDGVFTSPGSNGFYGMVLAAFLPAGGAPATVTGSGSVASKKATISGTGAFASAGVSGSAALSSRKAAISGTGAFAPASVSGTASLAARKAAISASGSFVPAAVAGTGAAASKKATISATGAYAPAGINGTATLSSRKAAISASGSFALGAVSGSASLAARKATVSASGAYSVSTVAGTAALSSRRAVVAAAGAFTPQGFVPSLPTLLLMGVGS